MRAFQLGARAPAPHAQQQVVVDVARLAGGDAAAQPLDAGRQLAVRAGDLAVPHAALRPPPGTRKLAVAERGVIQELEVVEVTEAVGERAHGLEEVGAGTERRNVGRVQSERTVAVRDGVRRTATGLERGGAADEAGGGERVRQHATACLEDLGEMAHSLGRETGVQRGHGSRAAPEQELHVRQQLGHGLRLHRRDYERRTGLGCLAGRDGGSRGGGGGRREAVVRPAHALAAERRRGQAAAGLEQHHSVLNEAEVEASLAQDQVPVHGHQPSDNQSDSRNQGTSSCNAQGFVPPLGLRVGILGEAGKDAALELGDVEAAEGADRASVRLRVVGAVAVGREELGTGNRAEVTGARGQEGRRRGRRGVLARARLAAAGDVIAEHLRDLPVASQREERARPQLQGGLHPRRQLQRRVHQAERRHRVPAAALRRRRKNLPRLPQVLVDHLAKTERKHQIHRSKQQ